MTIIDPEIIKAQVARVNYTGRTKTVKTQNGTSYLAEVSPTCLQNLLHHVRQHPNDKCGLNALGPQVREMLPELMPLLPPVSMGWWITLKHKENYRPKNNKSKGSR